PAPHGGAKAHRLKAGGFNLSMENKSDAAPQQLLTESGLGLFLGRNFPKELSYIPLQCQRLGEGPSRDARTQKNKDELT
ncbi:hypothetical protein, partial [Pseudomonas aeruginosa]|uniref:hypothetical protein n=1 Tax=Pseudomonas aeruginosa TaxID=287 RepID=UPI003981D8F5